MNKFFEKIQNQSIYCVVDSDLDGTGCRCLLEYLVQPLVSEFHLVQSSINNVDDEVNVDFLMEKFDYILFADLVPSVDLDARLLQAGKTVYIFDHHETTRELFGPRDNYYYDLERCSARILYDELVRGNRKNKCLAEFIGLVDTYDRFVTDSANWQRSQYLNHLLWATVFEFGVSRKQQGRNRFIAKQLLKFNKMRTEFSFFDTEEALFMKRVEKEEADLVRLREQSETREDDAGKTYGYFEAASRYSSLALSMLMERKDWEYVMIWRTWDKKEKKFSLRCRQDGSEIKSMAEAWGGGGHPQAAGFVADSTEMFEGLKDGTIHPTYAFALDGEEGDLYSLEETAFREAGLHDGS